MKGKCYAKKEVDNFIWHIDDCFFVGVIVLKNSNKNSYVEFIDQNFSESFLSETSEIQRKIRADVLEKSFKVVNSENQSLEEIKISEENENKILESLLKIIDYIDSIEYTELSVEEGHEFEKFRKDALKKLNYLYARIDEYNESIVETTVVNSNYYFELQKELTSPIESINSYIVLITATQGREND